MAFWGAEVKAGRPVTHKFDHGRGRLRISQAALGLGSASNKSVVQCNIGKKSPVILCVLLPDKTESCHLDLEFEETGDVVFSVIGPRSVHLSGYYFGSRHLNHNDSSESYGIDIANSDSEHSAHDSDEDSYEDSFINDDDPEVFSDSPISTDQADEEISRKKKPRKKKLSRKRLKKRYKPVVSEDDINSVPETDDEDCAPISTLLGSRKTQAEEKLKKEMSRNSDKEIENGEFHMLNQDNSIHDKKIEDIDNQPEFNEKGKERTPEGVWVLENNDNDCVPILALVESKTTQAEGKLEKEISKIGDEEMENHGSHLHTRDNSMHDEKTDDIDNVAVNGSESKKKIKEETKETPEAYSEIQNIVMEVVKTIHLEEKTEVKGPATNSEPEAYSEIKNIVREDEKTLHMEEKTEEKRHAIDSEEDLTCGDSLLMESKTTQAEGNLEKEIIKTGDKKIENGGSHLEIRDDNLHDNKTDDIDNPAVNASKSRKKRKKRTEKTPEAYGTIQNIVTKDEKKTLNLEEKTDEKGQVTDRGEDQACDGSLPSTKSDKEIDVRPKKRRKKSEGEDPVRQVNRNEGGAQVSCNEISMENKDQKLSHEKDQDLAPNQAVDEDWVKDKKRRKKKMKTQVKEENEVTGVGQLQESDEKNCIAGSNDENIESKLSNVKTLSNGLIIEDIDMGKPDGRVATSGKKIKVHYVGKLRDGGHIFDSNIGKAPLKFRLGDEGVAKGWNIGLDGMRVGGKRRVTIPPTNGDGSQGAGENVPPNSWLVYDFELVRVR